MGRRLSDWLLTHPVLLSPDYPYDVALLHGAVGDNGLMDERLAANLEEFNRRYAFPRLVPGRAEDFFREVERRWAATLPVPRGGSATDPAKRPPPPPARAPAPHRAPPGAP